ncbi:MAG: SDR family oxidoreductase [Trichodesmium erythraeum GBRTRLIN201]|nr:SDR family oxidoreductase [Trichodesmium erythraeum GBRTRLIN201]
MTAKRVSPGTIDTIRISKDYPNLDTKYEIMEKMIPVGRLASCQDIVETCLYIASDCSGFVNGQVINVNGGGLIITAHLDPII